MAMEPSFRALLERAVASLVAQHERDINNAVQALQEENRQLKKDLQELAQQENWSLDRCRPNQPGTLGKPTIRAAASPNVNEGKPTALLSDESLDSLIEVSASPAPGAAPAPRPESLGPAAPRQGAHNVVFRATEAPDADPAAKKHPKHKAPDVGCNTSTPSSPNRLSVSDHHARDSSRSRRSGHVDTEKSKGSKDSKGSDSNRKGGRATKILDEATKRHDEAAQARQRAHLNRILGMPYKTAASDLRVDDIQKVMVSRPRLEKAQDPEWVTEFLAELVKISPSVQQKEAPTRSLSRQGKDLKNQVKMAFTGHTEKDNTHSLVSIKLGCFVDLMLLPDLEAQVGAEWAEDVALVKAGLLAQDVDDVIEKVSRAKVVDKDDEQDVLLLPQAEKRRRFADSVLGTVVSLTVLASVLALGVSMDIYPESKVWVALECFCAVVFFVEFLMKVTYLERGEYWCGKAKLWNWSDFIITAMSVSDLVLTIMGVARVGKFALALRGLRVLRMVRLIKVLRTPLVKDLANMLYGVILGAPALFWVLVLLMTVVYLFALSFRLTVEAGLSNSSSGSLLDECGFGGDNMQESDNEKCTQHGLYGEEFFGTMPKAMFTVFRCMTWDCSTAGGQSLTVHFSNGYGVRFYVVYYIGTVILVFGIFNVITAIFVESTMNGLKFNDSKRKLAAIYESQYVQRKLKALVKRIYEVLHPTEDSDDWMTKGEGMILTEEDFYKVLQDKRALALFEDLDVTVSNPTRFFDIFDTDGDGEVDLVQIIDTLMMLRGELAKSDMVASLTALHGLGDKVEELERVLLESQREMILMSEKAGGDEYRDLRASLAGSVSPSDHGGGSLRSSRAGSKSRTRSRGHHCEIGPDSGTPLGHHCGPTASPSSRPCNLLPGEVVDVHAY